MRRRQVKYILPRLRDCKNDLSKQWYVEYSFRNMETSKLERFRIYEGINEAKTRNGRLKTAQKIVDDIVARIRNGWTPFCSEEVVYHNRVAYDIHAQVYGAKTLSQKNLLYYINAFLAEKEPLLKKKTYQDYTSKLRILHQFFRSKGKEDILAQDVTNDHLIEYCMFLITERKLQRRTITDSTARVSQLFNWLINKKVVNVNPVYNLPEGRQTTDSSAQPMVADVASHLLEYIKANDPQVHLFCAMIFYCAIRPGTELRLLKIKHINFFTNTITINSEDAKVDLGVIRMPPPIVEILKEHNLHLYDREYYVFGKKREPSDTPWGKNRFRMEFNKYRDALNLPKEYKLYSWKCTGAILFAMSGAPLPAIRDHLRHKRTQTTDVYLSKRLGVQNDYVKYKFPKI